MQLKKDKEILQDYTEATRHEWLETNGLGGWASSSIIGCNTRRYHGLLVAAIVPPVDRMALVAKLDETIVTPSGRHELMTEARYETAGQVYFGMQPDLPIVEL